MVYSWAVINLCYIQYRALTIHIEQCCIVEILVARVINWYNLNCHSGYPQNTILMQVHTVRVWSQKKTVLSWNGHLPHPHPHPPKIYKKVKQSNKIIFYMAIQTVFIVNALNSQLMARVPTNSSLWQNSIWYSTEKNKEETSYFNGAARFWSWLTLCPKTKCFNLILVENYSKL